MPTILTDLVVSEVSLVDRPACSEVDPETGIKTPRARVALYKNEKGEKMPEGLTLEDITKRQDALEAENATLKADLKKNEERITALGAETETLKTENEALKAAKAEADAEAADVEKMSPEEKEAFQSMSADKKKEFRSATPEKKKSMMDGCKTKKGDEVPEVKPEVTKQDLDTTVQKLEEKQAAELKKRDDEIQVLKSENEVVRKAARLANFVDIAKSDMNYTPGTSQEHGELLMKLADTLGDDSAEYKKVFSLLKTGNAAINKANFIELGRWGGGGVTPNAKIKEITESIAKRDNITPEQALIKAYKENPDLWKEARRDSAA